MNGSIRVLHLEDDPRDAELIRAKLNAAGLFCEITGVSGKKAFEVALDRDVFDIVLSDYNLPDYDGMSTIRRVHDKRPELPVIVISGAVGEDEAVECLKAGATDYVLKQRPQRLGAAVRRALMEKAEQEKRREAENALRESKLRFRRVAEQSPDAIVIHQGGKIVFANDALARLMRAASAADLVGQPVISLVHPERREVVEQRIQQLYAGRNLPLNEQ